jgi:ubiquinone/menaquinone biosynthesis C-methylase UbiE
VSEAERIRQEYRRRARAIPADRYALTRPENLFQVGQRERRALAALRRADVLPLEGKAVLEVGCGSGGWLTTFEAWGVSRADLAGIDLDETRLARARRRLCAYRDEQGALLAGGADLRLGDAAALPWDDGSFDVVLQSTVFSSVLDAGMRRAVAAEMLRVLKPHGIVLWYDFYYNNPSNPNVRGVGRKEIAALFPRCDIRLRRVTLAPPLARRVVPRTWLGAALLEALTVFNTHYLGVVRKAPAGLPPGTAGE